MSAARSSDVARAGGATVGRPFGSKAETLAFLDRRLRRATIPELVYFSVADWLSEPGAILRGIAAQLRAPRLAVRSSASGEDGIGCSLAGRYASRLDVANTREAITAAIGDVVSSYDGAEGDQVLVQEMAPAVRASGVILTRDPETDAPYYVVEYHDGSAKTDIVTSGRGHTKTFWIHHGAPLAMVRSPRLLRILAAVREIEAECGPRLLEIEFAEAVGGAVFVLQVRPVAARVPPVTSGSESAAAIASVARIVARHERPQAGLAGRRSILGQMPDWNPAELIGAVPSPLAVALFRFLISDEVWRRARAAMGYRRLPGVPLMRLLLGRPYVDVRASFHSFLPAGLPADLESTLVDAWLDRLDAHPELHDRVELEVAQTTFDLDFFATHRSRHGDLLSASGLERWAAALRCLTNEALAGGGTLHRSLLEAERRIDRPPGDELSDAGAALGPGFRLLAECRARGTLPFAVVARHAFLATALLRSAVRRGALSEERCQEFHRSLRTVAAELATDLAEMSAGRMERAAFLGRYGHLRPGTFDIASLRYDQRPEVLAHAWPRPAEGSAAASVRRAGFALTSREAEAIDRLLAEAGLWTTATALLGHAAAAIVGRERAKFRLTRRLSDALEAIATWGAGRDLSRDDLAHLTLADLHRANRRPGKRQESRLRDLIARRRARGAEVRGVRLPPLVRSVADLWVCPEHATRASFVTARSVTAPPVLLHRRLAIGDVTGRIVCIESADPGFDWIFAKPIAGLVTGFGGGNSHMAIRCVELDVPAALGVGERALAKLARSPSIELRCGEGIARSLWPDVLA
jgi:glutamine kinase